MIRFTILGQVVGHKNSYHIVTIKGRPAVVKSKEALAFERDARRQIPPSCRQRLEGPVRVTLRIFYGNERPDLDESMVLDVMQDRFEKVGAEKVLAHKGVYRNDRQVREKHVFHGIDRANPRTEIEVEPLQAQQDALALPDVSRVAEEVGDPF